MYGNESLPSLVMRFGCKPPQGGAEVVAEQARLAHRYRNRLVEIELGRRARVEQAVKEHDPVLPGIEQEIERWVGELAAVRDGIRRRNSERRRREAGQEDREAAKRLRATLKQLRAQRKERRAAAFADGTLRAALDAIDAESKVAIKEARAASGLYWGTYLVVENAMSTARKGAPPRFKRWDGSIHLAVQLQGAIDVGRATSGDDNRIWIEPLEGRVGWTTVHLRVASQGRDPVWASVRTKIHRPIPSDCTLKWAHLICTPIGPRHKWSVQLVVSRASGWAKPDLAKAGTVGIDLGWRVLPNNGGLRVAYAVGDDGQEEQLILPMDEVGRWHKVDDLRSIRDRHFNECRDRLADWLASHRDTLPEWLRERTAAIRQWRSVAQMAALCLMWRDQRFDGDAWVFEGLPWGDKDDHLPGLEQWRKRDRHLWSWETSQAAKAVAWRRDLYRNFVARLSRRYRVARIEDCDWKEISRHLPAEESQGDRAARLYRRIAAPGTLAGMIEGRFATTERVNPAYTTQTCHACGSHEEFDAAKSLRHRCEACGAAWDQDRNAAINLLRASGSVVPEAQESLGA